MSPELDAALVRDFPNLYNDRHGDLKTTLMCWGFDHDDGWEPIIRELSAKLESIIVALPEHTRSKVKAMQVKEKFGTLCFYMTQETEEMTALIQAAEERSTNTCEICGVNPASLVSRNPDGRGWLKTLCSQHVKTWQTKKTS